MTFTHTDFVELMEILIDRHDRIISRPEFRDRLDRNTNLYVNQVTRKATQNVAYKRVDRDVETMSDADFWAMIDNNEFGSIVEDNASQAIYTMAEKLKLI